MTGDPAGPHFELFRERFQEAAQAAGGPEERFVSVAGVSFQFAFAGAALRDVYEPSILPPLRIGDPGPAGADVSIEVFDTKSTGVRAPSLSWRHEEPERNHLSRYAGSEIVAIQDYGNPALTLVRPSDGVAVHHAVAGDAVPWVERGTAFRFAMGALLSPHDRHLLHGAVVGADGKGLLVAGPSGAGKSTLSIACLERGLQWVGDDYVVLEPGQVPVAHVLNVVAKLNPDAVESLGVGHLVRGVPAPPDDKAVLVIPADDPNFVTSLELRGILVPRITGHGPRISPASAAQAFSALAPTTMFQPPSRSRAGLAAMGALVKQIPAAFIDLGPDHDENAAVVLKAADEL